MKNFIKLCSVILILSMVPSCKKKTVPEVEPQKITSIDSVDYYTQLICKKYYGKTIQWAADIICNDTILGIDTNYSDSLLLTYISRDTILPAHHNITAPYNYKLYLIDSNFASNKMEFFVCGPNGIAGGYKKLIYIISKDSVYYVQEGPPPCTAINPIYTPYLVGYFDNFNSN